MCAFPPRFVALLHLLVLCHLLANASCQGDVTVVRRCCHESDHLSADSFECVPRPGMQAIQALREALPDATDSPRTLLGLRVVLIGYGHQLLRHNALTYTPQETHSNSALFSSEGQELVVKCLHSSNEDITNPNITNFCFDFESSNSDTSRLVFEILRYTTVPDPEQRLWDPLEDCCVTRWEEERGKGVESDSPYALPEQQSASDGTRSSPPPAGDPLRWSFRRSLEGTLEVEGPSNASTRLLCVDSVGSGGNDGAGTSQVLLARVCTRPAAARCVRKCCPAGRALTPQGACETMELSPRGLAVAAEQLAAQADRENGFVPFVRLNQTEGAEAACRGAWACGDLSALEEGVRRVLGLCGVAAAGATEAPLAVAGRVLPAVAAGLLVCALVSATSRAETRASAHGRGLLAHAASLLAASALQATWALTEGANGAPHPDCNDAYAYATYFCMVASGFWLNVVSINMAIGFGRAVGRQGLSVHGGGWRHFAFASTYAWGGAAALTALAVAAHRSQHALHAMGFVAPSFVEARTCVHNGAYLEEILSGDMGMGRVVRGPLLFFYAPMGVLALVNVLCLAMTACALRRLRSGSQGPKGTHSPVALTRTHVSNAERCVPRGLQDGVLYVKLLLTAGVVDFAAAGAAWAAWALWATAGAGTGAEAGLAHEGAWAAWAAVAGAVDAGRAAAVWWLCCGRWCGADHVGCWFIDAVDQWLRRRFRCWRLRRARAQHSDNGNGHRVRRTSTAASFVPAVLAHARTLVGPQKTKQLEKQETATQRPLQSPTAVALKEPNDSLNNKPISALNNKLLLTTHGEFENRLRIQVEAPEFGRESNQLDSNKVKDRILIRVPSREDGCSIGNG